MNIIKYDVVIPLAKKDVNFVHWVIEYIRRNFDDAQNIYILTNGSLFSRLRKIASKYGCCLIDEDKMLEGLYFEAVRKSCLKNNQRTGITGYYFQQFLKMGFALTPYCKEYYLTWDSDTIPLSRIQFFKEGHPQFCIKREFRKRYFEVMKELIGLDRQIDGSFIAEHMMFNGAIMRELVKKYKMALMTEPGLKEWWTALITIEWMKIFSLNLKCMVAIVSQIILVNTVFII